MIAFEIILNGQKLCTAGAGDLGVVATNLCWVRRKSLPDGVVIPDWTPEELTIDVGGIDSYTDEHLRWLREELKVGDTVEIRVIEIDRVDEPESRSPIKRTPVK